MLDFYSINSNKLINLLDNLVSIVVHCDFYATKNISSLIDLGEDNFHFSLLDDNTTEIQVTLDNVISKKSYVTNEINNGFEWAKIKTEIKYKINNENIKEVFVSDWLATDADIF